MSDYYLLSAMRGKNGGFVGKFVVLGVVKLSEKAKQSVFC